MINIAERPAEAEDRAVPGHWEGDLIIGKQEPVRDRHLGRADHQLHDAAAPARRLHAPSRSATRFAAKIQTLPEVLRASLTWDQGPEMRDWKQVAVDGRHRNLFLRPPRTLAARPPTRTPTGCSGSISRRAATSPPTRRGDLDWVAAELNDRPRKRLGFRKPVEEIADLLLAA